MIVTINLDNDLFLKLALETPDGGDIGNTIISRLRQTTWKKYNTGRCFGNQNIVLPQEEVSL